MGVEIPLAFHSRGQRELAAPYSIDEVSRPACWCKCKRSMSSPTGPVKLIADTVADARPAVLEVPPGVAVATGC